MRKVTRSLAVVAPAVVLLLTSLGAGRAAAGEAAVVIENMRFAPATLTVRPGDQVVWHNRDLVSHTVTAAGTFDSKVIEPGKSWTYAARQPGRYAYACSLHPSMVGTLIVK